MARGKLSHSAIGRDGGYRPLFGKWEAAAPLPPKSANTPATTITIAKRD